MQEVDYWICIATLDHPTKPNLISRTGKNKSRVIPGVIGPCWSLQMTPSATNHCVEWQTWQTPLPWHPARVPSLALVSDVQIIKLPRSRWYVVADTGEACKDWVVNSFPAQAPSFRRGDLDDRHTGTLSVLLARTQHISLQISVQRFAPRLMYLDIDWDELSDCIPLTRQKGKAILCSLQGCHRPRNLS